MIYFDNAATTIIHPDAINAMVEIMNKNYGNPSSVHSAGRSAKAKVESSRKYIANSLGVLPREIIFTSGGTEGDNMVLQSAVNHLGIKHIISSPIEHHAVLYPLQYMADQGIIQLHMVKVLRTGLPDIEDLKRLLEIVKDRKLVSLMHVNNEVGTKIDLNLIGSLCHQHNALFHSDTVQSIGHLNLQLGKLPLDFAVASAHKFHGPKGIGFLYAQKNTGLGSLIMGGSQERGLRAGTESVHNIVGMETAFRISCEQMDHHNIILSELKQYCIKKLKNAIPEIQFNGSCTDIENSANTIVNVRLPINEEKARLLAFQLDLQGICCSKGSACQSGSDKGSHVLETLLDFEQNKLPSLRFSFSSLNTKSEVDILVDTLFNYIKN
jgi:cysteine desulfurase